MKNIEKFEKINIKNINNLYITRILYFDKGEGS